MVHCLRTIYNRPIGKTAEKLEPGIFAYAKLLFWSKVSVLLGLPLVFHFSPIQHDYYFKVLVSCLVEICV